MIFLMLFFSVDTLSVKVDGRYEMVKIDGVKGEQVEIIQGEEYVKLLTNNEVIISGGVVHLKDFKGKYVSEKDKGKEIVVNVPKDRFISCYIWKVDTVIISNIKGGLFFDNGMNDGIIKIINTSGNISFDGRVNYSPVSIVHHRGNLSVDLMAGRGRFYVEDLEGKVLLSMACDTLVLKKIKGDIEGKVFAKEIKVIGGEGNIDIHVPWDCKVKIEKRKGEININR